MKIIGGLKTEAQLPLWEGEEVEQIYKPKHRITVDLTARLVVLIWSFKHRFHVFYLRWCLNRGCLSLLNELAVCRCSKYTWQWWFVYFEKYSLCRVHPPHTHLYVTISFQDVVLSTILSIFRCFLQYLPHPFSCSLFLAPCTKCHKQNCIIFNGC